MVNFPGDTHRLAIVGRTGSGKTVAAAWHLSGQPFHKKPWVIVNTKGDALLNKIGELPNVHHIGLNEKVGKRGLYIIAPRPDQQEQLDAFLWQIWARENCGVYIDEGYMVGKIPSFNALLTQGRSKKIPMIVLSQRPVWLSRFVFSEADFYQVFWLNDERDRETVQAMVPFPMERRLQEYHSYWYDVGTDQVAIFGPVPPTDTILETFSSRLHTRKLLV